MRWQVWPAFLFVFLIGCGESAVPVSGKVMLDKKPLANATVTFTPMATGQNAGTSSIGTTNGEGEFSLSFVTGTTKGAVIGKHKVSISAMEGESNEPAGAAPKPRVDRVPAEYNINSGLTFDVPAGGTKEANFNIDTPRGMPK